MFKYVIFGLLAWGSWGLISQNQAMQDMQKTMAIIKNSNVQETPELILFKEIKPFKYTSKDLDCLARNIFFEAGTEDTMGKYAVAQVTLNRAESGKFPDDICGVIFQKGVIYNKVICQFSWYCEQPATRKPVNPTAYNESMAVAKKVLLEGFRLDGLKNAMYYHADYVSPNWGKEKIATIGRHIFYSENKAK